MKNSVHILLFSSVLAVLCSLLLYAATSFTEPRRKLNAETDKDRNFLSALGVPVKPGIKPAELMDLFNNNIKVNKLETITLYEYIPHDSDSGKPVSIAVPFSGPGFWAPIQGVLALEPDLLTIKGVRFYKQEETPGLGGEIASDWFQNQFKGKKIISGDGEPGFNIVMSGTPGDINTVDAITGATRTSERVQAMLDSVTKEIYRERAGYVGE